MKCVANILSCFRPADVIDDFGDDELTGAPLGSQITCSPRRLTLAQCLAMTNNFSTEMLGRGSFGTVYCGVWVDGRGRLPVAVKRLDPQSKQGHEEWMNEILLLGQLEHPSISRLLGYCSDEPETLLVYELCSNGSLENALFEQHPWVERVLPWSARMQIALDVAAGLEYLHRNRVIHRDLKAPNVLLTADMRACITDFGISCVGGEGGEIHVSTRIMGTMGYLDPEFVSTGHLTYASDTYAFGVLLLELVTGQRAMTESGGHIVHRVRPYLMTGGRLRISRIIDGRLGGEYDAEEARRMAVIAKHCVHDDPRVRPPMSTVSALLNGDFEVPQSGCAAAMGPVSVSGLTCSTGCGRRHC